MTKKIYILIGFILILILGGGFYFYKKSDFNKKTIEVRDNNSVDSATKQEDINPVTIPQESLDNKTDNQVLENNDNTRGPLSNPEEGKDISSNQNSSVQQKPASNDRSDSGSKKIINKLVSWGYQKSTGRKIDTIIVHSSYNALTDDPYDVDEVIKEYKEYQVSPHYLIDRKGNIYRLVADQNIAYHAGDSKTPDGRTGVNSFSLGIEMLTTKSEKYTDAQYDSLRYLLSVLKKEYSIKYVLGHKDIAPGRKDDPWNFEWSRVK